MLQSQQLQNNPNLYVFLPMLYTVWSDAILTPVETLTIRNIVDEQEWLSAEEKRFLLDQLNPALPPTSDQLKEWLEEIRKAGLSPDKNESLVDIGIRLASMHINGSGNEILNKAAKSLSAIEDALGMISREAAFNLMPANRDTVTASQQTQYTFDIKTLTRILAGPNEEIIQKVKTVIESPEFDLISTGDLSEYREKVLQWCKLLASHGFGSMAYPKE